MEISNVQIVRSPDESCTATITQVSADVRNTTPGENAGAGQVAGVVQVGTSYFVSPLQPFTLTETPQNIVFNFSTNPLPSSGPYFLTVVYMGPLRTPSGVGEDNAVLVGGKKDLVMPILTPQNPTLTCPDGSVNFVACSGTPPYSWATTKGVITPSGVNNETAVLTPPENPGSGVAGNAYGRKVAQVDGGSCAHNPGFWETTAMFGCNDNFLTCPSGNPAGAAFLQSCAAGGGECGQFICGLPKCACLSPTQNPGDPATCDIAKSNGVVHDVRTQAMIAAECRPCRLEMQGVAVTVTGADGAPASTTIAAQ